MSRWLVTYRRKGRYSDTDAQGIVWNANYAGYFDDALTDLFDELGLTASVMQLGGFEVVTAHLGIDFKAPARLGDVLLTRDPEPADRIRGSLHGHHRTRRRAGIP